MKIQNGSVAYVRAVLEQLGIKPSALAKKAGIATTTLTRALNKPDHKFVLSTSTLSKIAEVTGISTAPYLAGADQLELARRTIYPAEYFDPEDKDGSTLDRSTPFGAFTTVIGTVAPGRWNDPTTAAMEHMGLELTIAGEKPRDVFACGVHGNAAQPIAREGEFLICRRIPKHWFRETRLREILSGQMVIVQRRAAETFQIELTLQLLKIRKDFIELIEFSETNWRNSRNRTRLERPEEKKELRILGRVDYVARKPAEFELFRELKSKYR